MQINDLTSAESVVFKTYLNKLHNSLKSCFAVNRYDR